MHGHMNVKKKSNVSGWKSYIILSLSQDRHDGQKF